MSSARARRNDPSTSHAAAASVGGGDLTENQRAVMFVLRLSSEPILDEELVGRYEQTQRTPAYKLPRQSQSGIRSRRSEIANLGLLVEGEKRRMTTGRLGRTWSIKPNATKGDQ